MSQPQEKIVHQNLQMILSEVHERFELWQNDQYIGFVGFHVLPTLDSQGREVLELQHTIIDERYSRQGYARALVTMILDSLREGNVRFRSTCSYINDYLDRYPEYHDLIAS